MRKLKRKRAASADHDHAGPVHDAFDKAMSLALSFLGPEAPDTLGDGDAQPLSGLGAPAPLCNAEAEEAELGEEHEEELEEELEEEPEAGAEEEVDPFENP